MISMVLQSEQQRKIWLYFLDPRNRYAFIALFLGLVLVQVSLGKILLLLGLTWLGGALALDRARPSDQDLEELLTRDVEPLVEKAVQSLDPRDHEIRAAPLVLRGPIDLAAPAVYRFFTRPRTGKDGGRRSPINRVMILLPLEDHLGIYCCHHDSLSGQTSQVSVEEHHYSDVVSVTLEKDVERAVGRETGEEPPSTQIFSFVFTNGRRLSFPVSGGEAGLDKTVKAIKKLLQDRR